MQCIPAIHVHAIVYTCTCTYMYVHVGPQNVHVMYIYIYMYMYLCPRQWPMMPYIGMFLYVPGGWDVDTAAWYAHVIECF